MSDGRLEVLRGTAVSLARTWHSALSVTERYPQTRPQEVMGMTVTDDRPIAERSIPAWARERAEMLQGLYIHMLIFVLINAGLFGINWFTRGDDGSWWFQWPLLIWGLGLMVHVMVTVIPVFSSDWVERRAERLAHKGS